MTDRAKPDMPQEPHADRAQDVAPNDAGLEATVEWVHHKHQAQQALELLKQEVDRNRIERDTAKSMKRSSGSMMLRRPSTPRCRVLPP
jgi:hypothetical protein